MMITGVVMMITGVIEKRFWFGFFLKFLGKVITTKISRCRSHERC